MREIYCSPQLNRFKPLNLRQAFAVEKKNCPTEGSFLCSHDITHRSDNSLEERFSNVSTSVFYISHNFTKMNSIYTTTQSDISTLVYHDKNIEKIKGSERMLSHFIQYDDYFHVARRTWMTDHIKNLAFYLVLLFCNV